MDFRNLKIVELKYWDVFLHKDQTAIGRLYFWYKSEAKDLLDIPEEALTEFFNTGRVFKSVLIELFHPDLFNYLSLNNITRHLHIHIIPRYSKPIKRFDMVFKDIAFGKQYVPNKDFIVDDDVLIKIRDLIAGRLKNV